MALMTLYSKIKKLQIWNEPKTLVGIALILFSYIAGWPAVSALGLVSVWVDNPDLVMIGGPVVYFLSYLIMFAGIALTGKKYTKMLFAKLKGCLKQTLQFDFK